ATVEDVEAHPEAVERSGVDRAEVDTAQVAVPVDQQDILRDAWVLHAHEVRDRVRLAATGDLEEARVVAGGSTRGRHVEVEGRAALRCRGEGRGRYDVHGPVPDDLADVERVTGQP